ncbi:MAG: chromate transporter [Bacillota bacterium]|nr:chromate transporter [Bacillota bacterium]
MNVYFTLFYIFFKVGLFAFGGGNAMLPLIYQSVQSVGIMSGTDFSDLVALSQVTPGPVAVNAATYVGLQTAGIPGAIVATVAVCLPCFIIMMIVIRVLERFKTNTYVQGAFAGIRPATIGLIAAAVVFIADGVLVKGSLVSSHMAEIGYYEPVAICIFAASILLICFTKIKPIWVMLFMGFIGAMIGGFM